MTLQSMTRRLDRLGDGPATGIGEALEAACQRVNRRIKAWHDGGCTGPLSFGPVDPLDPLPDNASRAHRELRAKIEAGRARVLVSRETDR